MTWRDTMNAVRNEVAALGGDAYVLVSVDQASGYAHAEAYQCRVFLDQDLIPPDTVESTSARMEEGLATTGSPRLLLATPS